MALVLEMGWKASVIQRRRSRPPLGLRNLGNSCYLNSVLQCLTYTPPLANLCLRNHHSNLCQKVGADGKSECPFCLLERRIIRSLNLDAQNDAPSKIGSCLRLFADHFQWGRQEDAHEFLRYVIDACHNTCLKLLKGGRSSSSNGSTSSSRTVMKDIFGGSLVSQVKCLSCGNVSKKTDEIMDISLDLFHSSSVKDALRRFFQPEALDGENKYNCSICKKLSAARKQMFILQAPNVLVIQLKRFEGLNGGKINKDIAFEEVLLLSGFMSKASQDLRPEYSLFGSIVHSGYSPESGHYYAYIKDPLGRWYCCNDAYVSLSTSQEVLSEKVYILFYLRSNSKQNSVKPISSTEIKCLKSNGNGNLQIQKTNNISKPLNARVNGGLHSERNTPDILNTSKVLSVQAKRKKESPDRRCKRPIPTTIDQDSKGLVNKNGNYTNTEMHESSGIKKMLAVESASLGTISNYKSNLSGNKKTSRDSENSSIQHNTCTSLNGPNSVEDLDKLKNMLAVQTSSELRSCGWVHEVYSFMSDRKKTCSKAAGSPYDPAELRRLLVADAKKMFIPQLPESLKENLIAHLKSFSEGKNSLDS